MKPRQRRSSTCSVEWHGLFVFLTSSRNSGLLRTRGTVTGDVIGNPDGQYVPRDLRIRGGQYIWKKEFRDLKETRLKRLKTLEDENPG